jgi:hypothetical protein
MFSAPLGASRPATVESMSPDASPPTEFALAFAALAARRWVEGPRDEATLGALMRACAWIARAGGKLLSPRELVDRFRDPTAEWLPGAYADALIEDDATSPLCTDLIAEAGENPEAELAQAKVAGAMLSYRAMPRDVGCVRYRAFRQFLIEHPYSIDVDAMLAMQGSGVVFPDLYEPLPETCVDRRSGRAVFHACPRCGWPMRCGGGDVRCAGTICRSEGAVFRFGDAGTLTARGGLAPRPPVEMNGHHRLRAGPWRYTLLPGLAEVALKKALDTIAGVTTELWPMVDEYDLLVRFDQQEWRVDVKDWSDPLALARALKRKPPRAETVIVVPDYRAGQQHVLSERLDRSTYRVLTSAGLEREVRAASRKGAS